MWCQKCNKAYEDGAEVCEKCGQRLVEYTPIVDADGEDVLFMSNESPVEEQEAFEEKIRDEGLFDREPKLLITVIGEEEALNTMEMLEQNKIPSMKKPAEAHSANEECDNDFNLEEMELIDGQQEDEDYAAEFSALCEEALEGEELYDIFVPAGCFSQALRLVIEQEQGDVFSEDESLYRPVEEGDEDDFEHDREAEETAQSDESNDRQQKKGGFFGFFFKGEK